jgi:hypothetical protein
MSRKLVHILSILIALVFIVDVKGPAYATDNADLPSSPVQSDEPPPSACSNLDVIFIVDQSDSMEKNDVGGNREYAVEGMIDLLVDLAINQCPDSYHRIGVISFGAEGRTYEDIVLYDINPSTSSDAKRIRDELRGRVKAVSLGTTYPEPAFRKAYEMFNENTIFDDQPRKKVIIFITDGLPCVPGNSQCDRNTNYIEATQLLRSKVDSLFSFSDDLKRREKCLADLRKEYPETIPPAEKTTACLESHDVSDSSYEESTYIYTLLMHDIYDGYISEAVTELTEMSDDYAGELLKNQSENQIPTSLRKILSQLVGVRPTLLTGPQFAVNPYIHKLIVTAYKKSEEVQFTLSYTDAGGTVHTIQGGQASDGFTLDPDNGYYKFGANETYTILNPYPGIWTMSSSNPNGLDVYYQAIDADFREVAPFSQIPQYDRDPFYNTFNPFYLDFALYDDARNGEIVDQSEKDLFAIDVQAVVTAPDGNRITYPLKWTPGSHSFRADQPLQVPLEGQYKLVITGVTVQHEGEPVVDTANESAVFNKPFTLFHVESEFTGLDVFPIAVTPVSPLPEEHMGNIHATVMGGWPLKVLPYQVRVRLADENGNTMTDIESVLKNPDDSIQAQLIHTPEQEEGAEPAENISSEVVNLSPDATNPGEFIGTFTNFDYKGSHTLILTIDEDKVKDGYWPYQDEVMVEFTRTDCLFCRAGTYRAILGMVIAFILGLIAYNIAIRTNKVRGSLVFVDGSAEIATFGLYNGTNFRIIKPRELSQYPQLELKRLKIQNIGKKRRASRNEEQEQTSTYTGEMSGVRVDCVSTSGRKFSVNLPDDKTPQIYSDDTMARMFYEPVE